MYRVKKVYELPEEIKLPNCMYNVKPINSSILSNTGGGQNLNNCDNSNNIHSAVNGNANLTRTNDHGPASNKNKQAKVPSNNKRSQTNSESKGKSSAAAGSPMDTSEDIIINNFKKSNNEDQSRAKIISELESRQQEIIRKLLSLRDKLNSMNEQVSNNSYNFPVSVPGSTIKKSLEVVVNADPQKPPYSILFLAKLLSANYGSGVTLKNHVHSSVHENLPESVKLFNSIPSTSPIGNAITITVIWKKVVDREVQLIVDPSRQASIRGETNVARYLSRLLPPNHPFNYDNLSWDDIVRIDSVLEETATIENFDLKNIEKKLGGNSQFLFGQDISVADFVVFSAVVFYLNTHTTVQTKQFPRVLQWVNACQELIQVRLNL